MPERPSQIKGDISRFDRLAEAASRFVSEAAFFIISVILVVVWVPTVFLFDDIDSWQLILSTITSALAFLLIALLQNSERRYDHALHRKVDTIAAALAIVIRHDHDGIRPAALERVLADLEASIGLEERT